MFNHLLQKIDLGPERDSGRGPLLEFNVGGHPGDNTLYVNAKDMLSSSLLQARLIDLKLPIKIVERRLGARGQDWLRLACEGPFFTVGTAVLNGSSRCLKRGCR